MAKQRRTTTKRKPRYAYGTTCKAGEVPAPDLRMVPLDDERFAAWVRLKLRLVDGCGVLVISPCGKRKVGRYFAGPPKQFAEFVHPMRDKLRRKVPLSSLATVVRVVSSSEKLR